MSSYLPPSENLPSFNPSVFQTGDETGITLGEADARYVKKSGSIMTGSLSTPSLIVDGTNVETELNKISSIEDKTTDLSFNSSVNVSIFTNNLSVGGIFSTPNVISVDTAITTLQTQNTRQSFSVDTTTFTGNIEATEDIYTSGGNGKFIGLSIDGNNFLKITKNGDEMEINFDNEDDALFVRHDGTNLVEFNITETKLYKTLKANTTSIDIGESSARFGVGYFTSLNTTAHSNVDTAITNLEDATTGITYNSVTDLTTIDNNILISGNLNLPNHSNVDTDITNLETATTGITYNSETDLTTIDNNFLINGNLNLPNHDNVDTDITNLEDATTGITYTIGTDLTTIDNNVLISGNLDLPNHDNVDQAIVNLERETTGITYNSVTDTTTIDNNLIVTEKVEAQSGVYQKTMIFNDTGDDFDSEMTGGNFGDDAYFRDFGTSGRQYIIDNFGVMGSGIFTFSATGTYKVEVNVTVSTHNTNYPNNQRHTLGVYISLNDENATRYPFKLSSKGRTGCIYIRDNDDGVGGSCYLQDYLYISSTDDNLRIKTLVDSNDSDSSFDDTLANNRINVNIVLFITQICKTTNILQTP